MAASLVSMLVLAAGCTARTAAPSAPPAALPFAACTALTAPPAATPAGGPATATRGPATAPAAGPATAPADSAAGPAAAPAGSADPPAGPGTAPGAGGRPVGRPLPDLVLPCLTGGAPVRLAELRGPAVVNLWASWCGPCRRELPALQAFADRAAGRVHVLGVVTHDERERAASLATDLGVTFPAVDDPQQRLMREVGAVGLPSTVLVDRDGRVRYVQPGKPVDGPSLAALVRRHLAVTVAP